jgi:hypothetical protein
MTTYDKITLKTFFETGDIPTGTDYANFIDSCVNVAETSAQTINGPINPTELITARVSATNANITGILSANTVNLATLTAAQVTASAASVTGSLSVGTNISAAAINLTGDVSAATGTVYASAMRSTNGFLGSVGIVSAAGSAQGTAALLTNVVNRGKGIVDGQTTGFALLANRTGLVQYLFNEGASANLWPPTGGIINGLAVNTAFSLAASAMVTIVHLTASAYAVK